MEAISAAVQALPSALGFALAAAIVICVPAFAILRVISFLSSATKRTAHDDIKQVKILGAVVFTATLVVGIAVGAMFSGMCGTGDITEFEAPDREHKIVVYNFDCGATTDFSLNVSLLNKSQSLSKHKTAMLLYSHYHQRPVSQGAGRNFQVSWIDSAHVKVSVEQFDGPPEIKKQDGTEVTLQQFP